MRFNNTCKWLFLEGRSEIIPGKCLLSCSSIQNKYIVFRTSHIVRWLFFSNANTCQWLLTKLENFWGWVMVYLCLYPPYSTDLRTKKKLNHDCKITNSAITNNSLLDFWANQSKPSAKLTNKNHDSANRSNLEAYRPFTCWPHASTFAPSK